MARYTVSQKAEAEARLREWLNPGDTVYCVLRSVAKSGMSRVISFLTIEHNTDCPYPLYLDHSVAALLDCAMCENPDGVRVQGCGMDMGHHIVYNLSSRLFGDARALRHQWL